jgi:hypothetical protein
MNTKDKNNKKYLEIKDIKDFEEEQFKCVQLYVDKKPVLIFGEQKQEYSEIIESYLDLHNTSYFRTTLADNKKGPKTNGKNYVIVGTGIAQVDCFTLSLSYVHDNYEIKLDPQHIIDCNISGFDVLIENINPLEKVLLNDKIDLLHNCIIGDFNKAQDYVNKIQKNSFFELEKTYLEEMVSIYQEVKAFSKNECVDKTYNSSLIKLRDFLLK